MLNKIPTIDLKPLLMGNLEGVIEISKQLKSDFAEFGFAYRFYCTLPGLRIAFTAYFIHTILCGHTEFAL